MRKVSAILIALTMMFCMAAFAQEPVPKKDAAPLIDPNTVTIEQLKLENVRLKLSNAIQGLTLLQAQQKEVNDAAIKLVEEYFAMSGKSRAEYDLNLQTLEFSKRPAPPEAKSPPEEK